MKRPANIILTFLFGFFVVSARAQSNEAVLRQIEADVWLPFIAASNSFDVDGFLAVQSKDLVRISGYTNEIYGLARYESEIRPGFKRARDRGLTRRSEVRFLQRVTSESLAMDTGYFRQEATLPNGEVRISFTRFEFVLRKEGKRWKILVDQDFSDPVTQSDFLKATPVGGNNPFIQRS
jgi:hypothetical protein